jgi:4-oxalomesaconate hydratase
LDRFATLAMTFVLKGKPDMTAKPKTALVISAHSADFVWRAGGAIALHAAAGDAVTVICLSFGERGESAKLWRQEGMTLEKVKTERRHEAEAAARKLGVHDIQFWNLGDYPLSLGQDALFQLVDIYRSLQPAFVLTHSERDIYNHDHPATTQFAQHARIIAQAHGHNPGEKVLGAPPVFLFEPHQPEQCDWKPDVLLDISSVWDRKRAIECMAGQEHLWEYYTRVALQRGAQAARNSDKTIKYGEGYVSVFPHVVERLA